MAQIKNITNDPFPYKSMDYAALRKEGIALIQKYSGHIWTDFNDHDPGVTILEVLCYALTELGYKACFPLEDILQSAPDKTGFTLKENAFYTAPEIFPCQPITYTDYRNLLIDRIEGVNNAWVFLKQHPLIDNMLEVWLLLNDDVTTNEDTILEEARYVLAEHRNLCENAAEVYILSREVCQLEATVFIETNIDPEKAAARILFELEKTLLNPVLKRYSTIQMLEDKIPLATIFEGPEMKHGYFKIEDLSDFPRQLDLLKVMNTILGVEGIYHITDLSITYKGKKYTNVIPLEQNLPIFLADFSSDSSHNLSFYKNDTLLPFKEGESIQFYEQLKSQHKRNYSIDTFSETAISYSEGRFRNIAHYLSIQNEFPHLYGIGPYGLSPDSDEKRAAQVKQLKGFLIHLEQLLANASAQLANLKKLFCIYPVTQTYFQQPLSHVPNITSVLLTADETQPQEKIIDSHYQQWRRYIETEATFWERRNQFLNHLLARFNVVFNEAIYYDFGYFPEKESVLKKLIAAKEYYLQNIVNITRNRGKGEAYSDKNANYLPLYFKEQLELLLDINLTKTPARKKLSTEVQNIIFDLLFMIGEEIPENTANSTYSFSKEQILTSFLKKGISKDSYKVEVSPIQNVHRILLPITDDWVTVEMETVGTMNEAIKTIERFCNKILQINISSEGFYIVEHLLLFPLSGDTATSVEKDSFYNSRMSLVFPSWSARFQEKGFREQVQNIVAEVTPAHIQVECFWINLDDMLVFEDTYHQWEQSYKKNPLSKHTQQFAAQLKALIQSYDPHDKAL